MQSPGILAEHTPARFGFFQAFSPPSPLTFDFSPPASALPSPPAPPELHSGHLEVSRHLPWALRAGSLPARGTWGLGRGGSCSGKRHRCPESISSRVPARPVTPWTGRCAEADVCWEQRAAELRASRRTRGGGPWDQRESCRAKFEEGPGQPELMGRSPRRPCRWGVRQPRRMWLAGWLASERACPWPHSVPTPVCGWRTGEPPCGQLFHHDDPLQRGGFAKQTGGAVTRGRGAAAKLARNMPHHRLGSW